MRDSQFKGGGMNTVWSKWPYGR